MVAMASQITTSLVIYVWDDGSVDLDQAWNPGPGEHGPRGHTNHRRLGADVAADLLLVLLDEACRR